MKIIKYIITFFLFFSSAIYAYETPDTFLKNSVQEVSAFITQNKEVLENNEEFLRSKVDQLIIPKLDIELMSKIVIGKKYWLAMSAPQRERFQLAFRGLMVRTYMKSLTAFDGERIKGLEKENEDILVKSFKIDEVRQMLKEKKIMNGLTLIALQWFFLEYYKS